MATRSRQRSFTSTSMYAGHAHCFPVSTTPSSTMLTTTTTVTTTKVTSHTHSTPPTSSFLSHRKRPPATSHTNANCRHSVAHNEQHTTNGDVSALVSLARNYETGRGVSYDFPRALSLYTSAATHGDMHGQFHLGRLHNSGLCGLPIDIAKAAEYYRLAGEQGHAPALCNLGVLYHTGSSIGGIPKDVQKAVKLYEQAATKGIPKEYQRAWYNLAICYETGVGVSIDLVKAKECYERSARDGKFMQGVCSLGACYQHGVGTNRDVEKAVRLYRKAARKKCARAAFYLGLCYEKGEGVDESEDRAERLFRHAMDLGLEEAGSYLQRFQGRMKSLEHLTTSAGSCGELSMRGGSMRRRLDAGVSATTAFNEQRRTNRQLGGNARRVESGHIGRGRENGIGVHNTRRQHTGREQSDQFDMQRARRRTTQLLKQVEKRQWEVDRQTGVKSEEKQKEEEEEEEKKKKEWVCMAQIDEGMETDFDTDVDSVYSVGGKSSQAGSMSSLVTWSRRGSTASWRF